MTRSYGDQEPRLSISSNDAYYPESRCIRKEKRVVILAHTAEGSRRFILVSKLLILKMLSLEESHLEDTLRPQ